MDATHVSIRVGGNDRCLEVVANLFPDPGKGQGLTIESLEVEGLTIAWTPLVKPTGWDQASTHPECIAEAGEGVNSLTPGIEKRCPIRGGESP